MPARLWQPDALWPLPPNPYVNHTRRWDRRSRLSAFLVGATLFLPRLALVLFTILASWLVAKLTSAYWPRGLQFRPDRPFPRRGWRRLLQQLLIPPLVRLNLAACGFHHVVIKGKPAPRHVAPIWVCNHQGFPDIWFFLWRLLPVGVSAAENLRFPIMSDVMASQQTIFVDREDKSSAARAAALIAAVAADNRFPPLVVYPEGNTSNGRQLCAFRAGPFAPLVAVQPVVISYARGGPVDPSWVEPLGPPVHLLALRMLLTPSLRMTAQYLAPMGPLAGEAPAAFGRRVQAAMASALGVPVVEYSFSDTRLMFAARKLGLDPAACCLEADKAQRLWGVGYEDARDALARFAAAGGAGRAAGRPDGLDAAGLAAALRLPAAAAAPRLGALLGTFSQGELSGFATFREFVAGCAPLARAAPRRPARPPGAAAALGGAGFVDRAAAALRATWI